MSLGTARLFRRIPAALMLFPLLLIPPVVVAGPPLPEPIVTVSIPYRLFLALASYHELSEIETADAPLDAEIIPVLKTLVDGLKAQYEIHGKPPVPDAVQNRLTRLSRHISQFRRELDFRRNRLSLQQLIDQQQSMIEGESP